MKLSILATFLVLSVGALAAAVRDDATPAKRWGPSAGPWKERDNATPAKRWGPSGGPWKERDAIENRWWPSARAGEPRTLDKAQGINARDLVLTDNRCPKQHVACGVSSSWSKNGWECIDTSRDLESCGGCVTSLYGEPATGVDCTSLEGVEDVACVRGECAVYSCRDGYAVGVDGRTCEPVGKKPGLHQASGLHF